MPSFNEKQNKTKKSNKGEFGTCWDLSVQGFAKYKYMLIMNIVETSGAKCKCVRAGP